MDTAPDSTLWTVTTIADRLGIPRHRVAYIIDARNIRAATLAGNARVFDDHTMARIEAELRRLASAEARQ